MPLKALLDPQGKAVTQTLHNIGLPGIHDVRIGKHIHLEVEADDEKTAASRVDECCKRLLCNEIMESYSFKVIPLK